ncbi:Two-component sensor histidine kinase [Candidatus Methylobacter favarea]|uniref:histidine kinase n=1 Tax=Candidatus Methylobacter favarea TaxID=2707345 RepID=A0A8S0WJF2_9GAMM|nr:ATP-binding protein [Candidatus Methylobacter favarea]CAA9891274.1 Two-component sensor histidine kinase [Candidatus Methylobacter favarea]
MYKSIRVKLFLTLLLSTLIVVAGMYAFMRESFERGFMVFVETRQKERIDNLIEALADYYAKDQGWRKLANNKSKWIEILSKANPHGHYRPPPAWLKQAAAEPAAAWPPKLPEAYSKRHFIPLEMRVMLLKADKSILFGRPERLSHLSLKPIYQGNQSVGFLGVLPGKSLNQLGEIQFMEQQTEAFVWIAVLMISLSASLALLLAYILGMPLKRITAASKALAIGRYDTRLPIDSHDELGQLAHNFNDLAAALEQAEQTRRRWVADISHELRTPLSVLRGELEALQDGIRPLTRDAVDSLYGDVMRLNRLAEDLYQLALSDQGALSYRKTQTDPLVTLEEDLTAFAPEFERRNISVKLKNRLVEPSIIHADPDRLSQLYRNLLKNTVNYTDKAGQLLITVSRVADKISFSFQDSAPGVMEEDLPKLFDRFYRIESSRSRSHGGAGLGLAICRNIAEAHNGAIYAAASPLGGLEIKMELPVY